MAEWEASKENVIPIKRGRAVKDIEGSNAPSELRKAELLEKQRLEEFEKNLRDSVGPSINQLNIYCAHYKWIRDTFPSNSEKALQFLERCTCDFKDDIELKNDQRFVKMWIEYADMVRTPGEVFTHMQQNKIGEKVALFWIAWAFVAEKNENFKFADQVFQKGNRKLAEPKEIMQKRYQQFQRRMARHFLNKADEMETQTAAGMKTSSSSSRNASLQNRTEESQGRVTLGKLSASQAVTSNRISTAQAVPLRNSSSPSSQPTASSATLVRRPPLHNAAPFLVYIQPDEPLLHTPKDDDANPDQTRIRDETRARALPKQADMRKENEGRFTTWSEAPLCRPFGNSSTQTLAVPVPAMQIFVDSPKGPDEAGGEVKPCKIKREESETNFKTSSTGLSIRRFLDGDAVPPSSTTAVSATAARTERGVIAKKIQKDLVDVSAQAALTVGVPTESRRPRLAVTETERIASDPLARHKAQDGDCSEEATSAAVPIASLVASRIKTATERSGRTDINSVVVAGVSMPAATFSIFTDAAPKPSKKPSSSVSLLKHASETAFTGISVDPNFSDSVPILKNPIPASQQSKQSSSSSREIASSQSKVHMPKPVSLAPRQPTPIVSAVAPQFHIFSDSGDENAIVPPPPVKNRTAQEAVPAAECPTPAVPLTEAPKAQSNSDAEKDEAVLQVMLEQMGVLDNEDGTINTRLARKDIDSMFCSPTINFKIDDRTSQAIRGRDNPAVRHEEFLSPLNLSSESNEISLIGRGFSNSACKALKPLPLPSFAGGTCPSSFRGGSNGGGHISSTASSFKIFGGNDLSAIKEASTEYSSIFNSSSSTQLEAESRPNSAPRSSVSSCSDPLTSLAQGIASGRVSRRGARGGGLGGLGGGLGSLYISSSPSIDLDTFSHT